MRKTALVLIVLQITSVIQYTAQDSDWESSETTKTVTLFNDTRVINGHSTETLKKGTLDFRITHRFGAIAVPAASRTLFGLDNSTDIRIAFEYGLTDALTLGFGRSKGFAPYSQLWDGFAKYAILQQSEKMPVSLSVVTSAFATSMAASTIPYTLSSFAKPAHRFSYYSQLIVAKQFFDKLTLQIAPGVMHRNFVAQGDQNLNFSLGGMVRYHVYKKLSVVAEYYQVFRQNKTINNVEYQNPLGFGLEIKTYAHVFQLNFMNSEGIGEGQFIPYTFGKWNEGQFRFGFTITRHF